MPRSRDTAPSSSRPRALLLALLVVLGIAYFALLPWRRRMAAETDRLNRMSAAREAEAARAASVRSALDAARAEVARDPRNPAAHLQLAQRCADAGLLDEAVQQAEAAS